jgi:hypothetical protein
MGRVSVLPPLRRSDAETHRPASRFESKVSIVTVPRDRACGAIRSAYRRPERPAVRASWLDRSLLSGGITHKPMPQILGGDFSPADTPLESRGRRSGPAAIADRWSLFAIVPNQLEDKFWSLPMVS